MTQDDPEIPQAKALFMEESMNGFGQSAGTTTTTANQSGMVVLSGVEIAPGTVVVPAENVIAAAAGHQQQQQQYQDPLADPETARNGNNSAISPMQIGVTPLNDHKRGHKCFGGCCDVRRATIITDIIGLVIAVLVLAFYVSVETETVANDDAGFYANEWEDYRVMAFVLVSLEIFFCTLGIIGAMRFNWFLVFLAVLWQGATFVLAFLAFNLFSMVIAGLIMYPHLVLISEIRRGIMAKETYESREKYSCCCT